ncbi:hypothetical protein MTR67_010242 [Solanum verrucosum]|uniref:Uncharacterized protein n=1 Tax=Solanum verrucosum TaxID=315347 RepID=A0AAF0Q4Q4_SOLVR|nr:hypothetical protein MTR67_010242 [Solanum verrucosum]
MEDGGGLQMQWIDRVTLLTLHNRQFQRTDTCCMICTEWVNINCTAEFEDTVPPLLQQLCDIVPIPAILAPETNLHSEVVVDVDVNDSRMDLVGETKTGFGGTCRE